MKISLSLFSIFRDFPSSLDKALIEKLMFVQIGLLCTLKVCSGTTLEHDFLIRKVGSEHLRMKISAGQPFTPPDISSSYLQ